MLEGLLGGLINKEQAVIDAIKDTLEDVALELQCNPDDFIIAIKPTPESDNKFKCYILKATPDFLKAIPETIVREITVKEIIGD